MKHGNMCSFWLLAINPEYFNNFAVKGIILNTRNTLRNKISNRIIYVFNEQRLQKAFYNRLMHIVLYTVVFATLNQLKFCTNDTKTQIMDIKTIPSTLRIRIVESMQ